MPACQIPWSHMVGCIKQEKHWTERLGDVRKSSQMRSDEKKGGGQVAL